MEEFTHPTKEADEVGGGCFLKFKDNGDCIFLDRIDKDTYSCRVYAARAGVCRAYPAKPGQQEFCAAHRKTGP